MPYTSIQVADVAESPVRRGSEGLSDVDTDDRGNCEADPLDPTGNLKMAYVFLMDCTVQQLRDVQRVWSESFRKVTQATKTFDFVANLMHLVKAELANGNRLEDLFIIDNDEWEFIFFTESWDERNTRERRPMWEKIFEVGRLPSPIKKKDAKGPASMFAPNFTNSEFARMIVLLVKDEQVRKALQDSVLEVTRGELDAGVNRDAFWSTLVAKKFNNVDYKPVYNFDGIVDGVDPSAAPAAERSGPFLKTQYQAGRKLFPLLLSLGLTPDRMILMLSTSIQD